MTNRTESKHNFGLPDAGDTRSGARMVGRARLAVEALSGGASHEPQQINPVPFNGLLTNKLLTELPGEDFARLLPYLEPVSLTCGDNLYRLDEGIRDVYFLESAVISHLYLLEDGSTTEAALIGREGLTGLSAIFAAPAPTHLTQTLIPGTALRVSADVLRQEFARGGAMHRLLLAYAGARIAQLSQRAVCNGRHSLADRLCNWLLMIHDRVGEEPLPLTHEQIARHLGTRRAGITGAAADLRDRHFIDYSRGLIRIIDRQGLEMSACECYRTLNHRRLMPGPTPLR